MEDLILIVLILIGVNWLLFFLFLTTDQSEEDPVRDIHRIGLEARQELDRISDDFMRQQLRQLLNGPPQNFPTDSRR